MLAPASVMALLVATAAGDRTLWLVQPLYPGQEGLVARAEGAIRRLITPDARDREIIGRSELEAALRGKTGDVSCLTGEVRCSDVVDAFVSSLGFDRVVLVRGGQDESGFTFRVASYLPGSGQVSSASSTHTSLERALFGAVAKVVPIAATLEVRSTPPGATVLVDDVRVGQTPLSTQVLPGERAVKLDLKGHQPVETPVLVLARGSATLERTLEKVAARVSITALPAGTEIFIDGQLFGKDRVDRGIQPGLHTIRLAREGHKAFEASIEIKPDDTYVLDQTLEPIDALPTGPAAVTAPMPVTPQEEIYARENYVKLTFESTSLTSPALAGRRYGANGTGKTSNVLEGDLSMAGVAAEYGTFGRHFGLSVIGLSYAESRRPWRFQVLDPETNAQGETRTEVTARVRLVQLKALQPQLRVVLWRLSLSAQAGLELRSGQILEVSDVFYNDGFQPLDLLLSGRANVRVFVVEGLFLEGTYAYGLHLFGVGKGGGFSGFTAGVGYAF